MDLLMVTGRVGIRNMLSVQVDYSFLGKIHKFGNILGVVSNNIEGKFEWVRIFYSVLLGLSVGVWGYFGQWGKGWFDVMVYNLSKIFFVLSIISLIIHPLFFREKRRLLTSTLRQMENSDGNGTGGGSLLVFLAICGCYLPSNLLFCIQFSNKFEISFSLMASKITFVLYLCSFAAIFWSTVSFLRHKYERILAILKRTQKTRENSLMLFHMPKIKRSLKNCHIVISCFNDIFGLPLFLLNGAVTLYIIRSTLLVHNNQLEFDNVRLIFTYFSQSLISTMMLVFLAANCQSLEKIAEEISLAAHRLRQRENDLETDLHLAETIIYVDKWKPKFSAAGFFDFNQKCINMLFTAVINYLVIVLQLHIIL